MNIRLLLDLNFLQTCQDNKIIPKFFQFKVANRKFHSSSPYNTCQKKIVKKGINVKNSKVKQFLSQLENIKKQNNFDFLDFCQEILI